MAHDTIILVRHGKPALSRKVRLTAREYRDWWAQYDLGGLADGQKVPKKVKSWAAKADLRVSSPLRRAVESVVEVTGEPPHELWPELVEAPLPSPPIPFKFRPKTWGTWSRIVWFWGWPDGMESHGQARKRANAAAKKLGDRAAGGKIVYVSGHGWFNRMLKGSLKAQGWKCVSQNGDLHWSHRRLIRTTRI